MNNRFKDLQELEFEKKYVGYFENKQAWADWYINNSNAFGKRFTNLVNSMSELERYIVTKRKRCYIPESMTNPFHLDFKSTDGLIDGKGVFSFSARKHKKEYKLTGRCKTELEYLLGLVKVNNQSKQPTKNKMDVFVSPIKTSLRGEPIKNSWAMKIVYADGSMNIFYHIVGMFHIATNIVDS